MSFHACAVRDVHAGVLDYARLTGTIPPEIGDLASLRLLDLNGNNINGSLPSSIGNLHLETLRLGSNKVRRSVHFRACLNGSSG